jgi:hypothetical protein
VISTRPLVLGSLCLFMVLGTAAYFWKQIPYAVQVSEQVKTREELGLLKSIELPSQLTPRSAPQKFSTGVNLTGIVQFFTLNSVAPGDEMRWFCSLADQPNVSLDERLSIPAGCGGPLESNISITERIDGCGVFLSNATAFGPAVFEIRVACRF